MHHDALGDKLP